MAQDIVATLIHIAQTKHDGFGFLGIEHQGR